MAKRFLKYFFTGTAVLLLLCILLVVTFDPFYQYHKPLPGLKAVLTDKEYQCAGSLKNFDYDAVIAGSSVSENYNNHWFDEGFNCTSIDPVLWRYRRSLLSAGYRFPGSFDKLCFL